MRFAPLILLLILLLSLAGCTGQIGGSQIGGTDIAAAGVFLGVVLWIVGWSFTHEQRKHSERPAPRRPPSFAGVLMDGRIATHGDDGKIYPCLADSAIDGVPTIFCACCGQARRQNEWCSNPKCYRSWQASETKRPPDELALGRPFSFRGAKFIPLRFIVTPVKLGEPPQLQIEAVAESVSCNGITVTWADL